MAKKKLKFKDAHDFCIYYFDFSPDMIVEYINVINTLKELVEYYESYSAALSDELRDRIADLKFRTDCLLLLLQDLYLQSANFMLMAKKVLDFGEEVRVSHRKMKDFKRKLRRAENEIKNLLKETRDWLMEANEERKYAYRR